jgi:hypothetical protein
MDAIPLPIHLTQPVAVWWLAIPEVCPPGEGMAWLYMPHWRTVLANDDHT